MPIVICCLDHYHIPAFIQRLVSNYLRKIKLRFTTAQWSTNWEELQKGIPTGCTISPIHFIMGMNPLLTAMEGITRGPALESGVIQPVVLSFMDNLTTTTVTHVQARWVLETLGSVDTLARLTFKARKSRSLIIRKGKVTSKFGLLVNPSIEESPIKCLGKWFHASVKDTANVVEVVKQTEDWLKKINGSRLPGKFKSLLYQYGLLPWLI